MVGVKKEYPVHRASDRWRHLGGLARITEHHVEKICRIVETVIRIHERLADGELVTHGCDGRHLCDQAKGRNFPVPRIRDVCGVVIERREGANNATHDGHRVRVSTESVEKRSDLLVHHRMARHDADELILLLCGRQFAVQEQVAGLEIVRVLGQLLDRVSPVQKHALVAVDKGDLGFTGCGRRKARVVGEVSVGRQLANVDDVWSKSP